jgi:hypothetical protein
MAHVLHRFHPRTLAQAPELAMLAALDKLLFLAARVLVSEHPTLSHHDPLVRRAEPPTLREGRRILRSIIPLRAALARYRRVALEALEPPPSFDDELPF